MKHSFLDKYADRDGPLQSADPRAKLLVTITLIICASLIQADELWRFIILVALIVPCLALSRVPSLFLLSRLFLLSPFFILAGIALPFTGDAEVIATIPIVNLSFRSDGLRNFCVLLTRGIFSLTCLLLFTTTTPFNRLLYGLRRLRIPAVLILTLDLMYRYIFVLTDEGGRMMRARNVRWRGRNPFGEIKILGRMIGSLWIRSYERGVRVTRAMLARGGLRNEVTILDSGSSRLSDWLLTGAMISVCVIALFLPTEVFKG